MTSKERVLAQIGHCETDYIPFTLDFEEDSDKDLKDGALKRVNDFLGGELWRMRLKNDIVRIPTASFGHSPPVQRQTTNNAPIFGADIFGTVWRLDQRPPLVSKPVLEKPSFEKYRFPPAEAYFETGWEQRAMNLIAANQDRFLISGLGFGLFERSWILRGIENVLMDAVMNPDFYQELIQRIFQNQMQVLDKVLKLPIDGFRFCEDWSYQEGIMIGAERWRKVFKPYLAQMYAKVHESGKIVINHMCGSVAEILPDLIEIGLDVYESVQPEARNNSPYRLKELHGDKLAFWGGLGSQSTIPFGSPTQIKEEVKKLCGVMGKGGGYILSCAKPIQPETPTENALAVAQAFAEQAGIDLSAEV